MRVNNINTYSFLTSQTDNRYRQISFKQNPEINFEEDDDLLCLSEYAENEESQLSTADKIKKGIADFYNKHKTRLWLCIPQPTKRNLKAFWKDPDAYTYEMNRPYTGKVLNKEVLAEIDIKNRKNNQTEKANIRKIEFDDDTSIYTIQKGKERLGYIDVDFSENGTAYIDYACTITGREDYRNLLMILIQAMVEDCINNKDYIPEIQATPAQIGDMTFDRKALYKFYGAETKKAIVVYPYGEEEENICYISPENIYKKLESIQNSPKRNFIMPSTESYMDYLREEYGEYY